MPDVINDLPEEFSYYSPTPADALWVTRNFKNLSHVLKYELRIRGWQRAYYRKAGKSRLSVVYVPQHLTFLARRKMLNGLWKRIQITTLFGWDSLSEHIHTHNGTHYFFPEVSGIYHSSTDRNPIYPDGMRSDVTVSLEVITEFYEECSECGAIHVSSRECPRCTVANSPTIRSYSYKPYTRPYGKKDLRFGFEIELAQKSRTSQNKFLKSIREKYGEDTVIFKPDGSIGAGIEIVTAPLLEGDVYKVMDGIFEKASEYMQATSDCGIHIHISKAPLTELQRGKLLSFINNEDNRKFLDSIAGRKPNHYCQREDRVGLTHGFKNGDRVSLAGKYTQYNISPDYTDEVRMFASTTDKYAFFTRFEFLNALVKYCAPGAADVPLKEHHYYKNFINWVLKYRKVYPNFFNHLVTTEAL